MKHYITISGEFDDDTLAKFVNDFNDIPESIDEVDIYLTTSGGNNNAANCISDILNNSDREITLIASDEISSAGFNLFFKTNVKRRITSFTLGMMHFTSCDNISVNESGKPVSESDKANVECMKLMRKETIKFCKSLGMSNSEIEEIKQGKEVYFHYSRLQEFLNNAIKTA